MQIVLRDSSLALKCMLPSPFCFEAACSKILVAGISGCPHPEYTSRKPLRFPVRVFFRRIYCLPSVEMPSTFSELDRRGVLEVWFVGSMRLVSDHQLVHHTREDDGMEVRLWRALFFQQRHLPMKHVVFIAASNCIEVSPGLTWNSQSSTFEIIHFETLCSATKPIMYPPRGFFVLLRTSRAFPSRRTRAPSPVAF